MVIKIANEVRETIEHANGQKVWPDPLLLWPETFIAVVSGISLSLSLRTSCGNSSYDSGSLWDPLCEKVVRI